MMYSVTMSNMLRDGFDICNISSKRDFLLCPPEEVLSEVLATLPLEKPEFRIHSSEITAIGKRRLEAELFLGGQKFAPTGVIVEIDTPNSADSAQDWSFVGRKRKRILFVCSGNSNRSQMAEGFVNRNFGDFIEAHSAGFMPSERVNENAVRVMKDVGIDISRHRPKSVREFSGCDFDYVVSVCDVDAGQLALSCASTVSLDFGVIDPVAYEGILTEPEVLAQFANTRDEIAEIVNALCGQISESLSFVQSRAARKRTAEKLFEPTRAKQKLQLDQLTKVMRCKVSGVEVIEAGVSDIKLVLNDHLEEQTSSHPMCFGFGFALSVTLLTSSFSIELLPPQTGDQLEAFLDIFAWILAMGALVWGLISWWGAPPQQSKKQRIEVILDEVSAISGSTHKQIVPRSPPSAKPRRTDAA